MKIWHQKISLPIFFLIIFLILASNFIFYSLSKKEAENYEIVFPSPSAGEINFSYGSWPELGNVNFFQEVLQKFKESQIDFLLADLDQLKLALYRNGQFLKEYPILAKGKEGSWWETPVGLYRIEAKSKNAYSSFGQVYMPYSLVFQGNFLIHGWPYYSNGQPVSSEYSGGCIRLKTEDAKEIFEIVEKGWPVLIFKRSFEEENSAYQYKIPTLSAEAYLVADLKNNFVFFEKNKNLLWPIASLTKLLTALVVLEHANIEAKIKIQPEMLLKTSVPRLEIGQRWSLFELLALLLVESSNEAGAAFSFYFGQDQLREWLNSKARSIGMKNTNLVDPNGIHPQNTATAIDIFQLAKYLYFNRSFVLKMTKGVFDNPSYRPPPALKNLNLFAEEKEFVGGKIGYLKESGEVMLAIFEIEFGQEKRPLAFIVLGSADAKQDILMMKNFIKNSYQFTYD